MVPGGPFVRPRKTYMSFVMVTVGCYVEWGRGLRTPTTREIVRITKHKMKLLSPRGSEGEEAPDFSAKRKILESTKRKSWKDAEKRRRVVSSLRELIATKRHLTASRKYMYIVQ